MTYAIANSVRICLALGSVVAVIGGATVPGHAAKAGSMTDCFADLERGTSAQIVCEFPLQPSPTELVCVPYRWKGRAGARRC